MNLRSSGSTCFPADGEPTASSGMTAPTFLNWRTKVHCGSSPSGFRLWIVQRFGTLAADAVQNVQRFLGLLGFAARIRVQTRFQGLAPKACLHCGRAKSRYSG